MKPIDAYFDYASPFSYLASEIVARRHASAPVTWRPMFLRGLEGFNGGVPFAGAKLAYLARDLARCAEHEGIVLRPPPVFPVNGLHLLRASLVAKERGAFDRFHAAAFRAVWAEEKDVSQAPAAVAILAEALGVPAAGLDEAIAAPAIKDALKKITSEAAARGAFGAPTFFVGDEMFWGHDRLDHVMREADKG